jgi:hypothetical protein
MRNARRLIIAGCVITGLPVLVVFILSASGTWQGGHDVPTIITLQAIGMCMAVSALLLLAGVSRAVASLVGSPVARVPLNVITSAIGVVALIAICFGLRALVGWP